MCGDPRPEHVGRELTLSGWAARRRDHGGLVFVDLRDHTGVTQLVVNPERSSAAAELAKEIRNEFVLRARGEVVARAAETVNTAMPTGEVELQVDELEIVSRSTTLPFQLDEEGVDETLRLRYRWLDLRREKMQRNLRTRAKLVSIIRDEMEAHGFVDVETPIMAKPTPEGARDFLVPTRLQQGRFFALPQSPQIYKQLLVIAGIDRYYQIARCFRDEDLRADRLQELTQLDVEMAFPDKEQIFALMERIVPRIWRETIGVELETPFPRMSWQEAERRFGSDKPDLRFGLEIQDATEVTRESEFGVFGGADAVRYLSVPRELSRTEVEKLEEMAKPWGAKGLAYVVFRGDGEVSSPIAKFLSKRELDTFREPGTTALFVADTPKLCREGARPAEAPPRPGARSRRPRRLGVPVGDADAPARVERGRRAWTAQHHPFTRPTDDSLPLLDTDPGAASAVAYDLVGNGIELAGGSIRIHEPDLQARMFDFLGISPEDAASEVRIPARRSCHGGTAARRHRLGHRSPDHGVARRAVHQGHGGVPQEPGRARPDERRPDGSDAGAASASSASGWSSSRPEARSAALSATLGGMSPFFAERVAVLGAVALLSCGGGDRRRVAAWDGRGRGGAHERAGAGRVEHRLRGLARRDGRRAANDVRARCSRRSRSA